MPELLSKAKQVNILVIYHSLWLNPWVKINHSTWEEQVAMYCYPESVCMYSIGNTHAHTHTDTQQAQHACVHRIVRTWRVAGGALEERTCSISAFPCSGDRQRGISEHPHIRTIWHIAVVWVDECLRRTEPISHPVSALLVRSGSNSFGLYAIGAVRTPKSCCAETSQ